MRQTVEPCIIICFDLLTHLCKQNHALTTDFASVPGVGLTPVAAPDKDHLQQAMTAAKKSDASLGRFSERVQKEDKYAAKTGKKRKVSVHGWPDTCTLHVHTRS